MPRPPFIPLLPANEDMDGNEETASNLVTSKSSLQLAIAILKGELENAIASANHMYCDLWKNSVCSSSKFLFRRPGILKSHFSSEQKSKKKEGSNASASVNVETGANKLIFPKLTVSPLRRFQLIDSDSDDPSAIDDVEKARKRLDKWEEIKS
ncbi:unnamed protein product [Fraxinus pennsylvanica]|uniref:Uncharacterized protein n=1 Tax=Fraxinus pennsylvanica TaxID=56036 RepID=A0AAD2AGY8_9LAMI|nr:unnamed protein product [Fraxinus pennsylvanica]